MAKKISDLVAATQLGDNDSFVFNDVAAGSDKRVTAAALKSALDLATNESVDDKASLLSAKDSELQSEINAFANGEGKTYDTLTEAMAVDPIPSNNTPFRVDGDTSSNGNYIYDSTEPNGYKFISDIFNSEQIKSDAEVFAITDNDDNTVFNIDDKGETDFIPSENLKSKVRPEEIDSNDDVGFSITDESDNEVMRVDGEGRTDLIPSENLKSKIFESFKTKNTSELVHIITYGQSLSAGFDSFPIESTEQKYDALMFNTGTIYPDNPGAITSFSPLIEQEKGSQGETPCAGIAQGIKEFYEKDTGVKPMNQGYQIIATACGIGGASIGELIEGASTGYFDRVKDTIDKGFALAQSLGKTYTVGAVAWLQGESNTNDNPDVNYTSYKTDLKSIQNSINSYAKQVTGQVDDVVLYTYQTCTNSQPAIAQLELSEEDDLVQCTGAIYGAQQNLIHFSGAASFSYGKQISNFIYKRLFTGIDAPPISPDKFLVQGNIILIRFKAPYYPLELVTYDLKWSGNTGNCFDHDVYYNLDYDTDRSNYGFSIKNGAGEEIIQNVELSSFDTIKINCSENVSGLLLKYASKRYSLLFQNGSYYGIRTYGGLRGYFPFYAQTSIGSKQTNWCAQFIKQL